MTDRPSPYYFSPEPDGEQLLAIDALLRRHGFSMSQPARASWFLDEIQSAIVEHGSDYWLRMAHLQEDFFRKSPRLQASRFWPRG